MFILLQSSPPKRRTTIEIQSSTTTTTRYTPSPEEGKIRKSTETETDYHKTVSVSPTDGSESTASPQALQDIASSLETSLGIKPDFTLPDVPPALKDLEATAEALMSDVGIASQARRPTSSPSSSDNLRGEAARTPRTWSPGTSPTRRKRAQTAFSSDRLYAGHPLVAVLPMDQPAGESPIFHTSDLAPLSSDEDDAESKSKTPKDAPPQRSDANEAVTAPPPASPLPSPLNLAGGVKRKATREFDSASGSGMESGGEPGAHEFGVKALEKEKDEVPNAKEKENAPSTHSKSSKASSKMRVRMKGKLEEVGGEVKWVLKKLGGMRDYGEEGSASSTEGFDIVTPPATPPPPAVPASAATKTTSSPSSSLSTSVLPPPTVATTSPTVSASGVSTRPQAKKRRKTKKVVKASDGSV
jgi:hypothetical protein